MKKANMLVTAMNKNDVIATSAIDHTKYDHYLVDKVNWGGNYEIGYIYRWNSGSSKFDYIGGFLTGDSIDIPNAVAGCYYIKVNGSWMKCEEHKYD